VPVGDASWSAGLWSSPAALPADARTRAVAAAVEAVASAGLVGVVHVAVDPRSGAVTGLRPWYAAAQAGVELLAGVDLVEQQLLVASGRDADAAGGLPPDGAAVLVLLRARAAGRLGRLHLPQGDGTHLETGVREGDEVGAGEVVLAVAARGQTDGQARERLAAAREELVAEGIELEEHS